MWLIIDIQYGCLLAQYGTTCRWHSLSAFFLPYLVINCNVYHFLNVTMLQFEQAIHAYDA